MKPKMKPTMAIVSFDPPFLSGSRFDLKKSSNCVGIAAIAIAP
jgi:hypothetical protein